MKTVSVKSFFKKVSEKATVRAGLKRPDLSWEFPAFESSDDLSSVPVEKVLKVLNKFTEDFGRKLIAQAGDDWDFVPSLEQVTFEKAFEDCFSPTSRSRLVTKDALQKLGAFYVSKAQVLGVAAAAALAGSKVIESRFALISGKNDALEVMSNRLLSLIEVCEPAEVEPFADLIEALIQEISALQAVELSADLL